MTHLRRTTAEQLNADSALPPGADQNRMRRDSGRLRVAVVGVRHTGDVDEPPPWVLTNWKARYVENVARLKSGDPNQIAEVVETLTDREHRFGLSQGERRMLTRAVQLLGEAGTDT